MRRSSGSPSSPTSPRGWPARAPMVMLSPPPAMRAAEWLNDGAEARHGHGVDPYEEVCWYAAHAAYWEITEPPVRHEYAMSTRRLIAWGASPLTRRRHITWTRAAGSTQRPTPARSRAPTRSSRWSPRCAGRLGLLPHRPDFIGAAVWAFSSHQGNPYWTSGPGPPSSTPSSASSSSARRQPSSSGCTRSAPR